MVHTRRYWRQKQQRKKKAERRAKRIRPQPPGTFRRVKLTDGTIYETRPDGWRKVGYKA